MRITPNQAKSVKSVIQESQNRNEKVTFSRVNSLLSRSRHRLNFQKLSSPLVRFCSSIFLIFFSDYCLFAKSADFSICGGTYNVGYVREDDLNILSKTNFGKCIRTQMFTSPEHDSVFGFEEVIYFWHRYSGSMKNELKRVEHY